MKDSKNKKNQPNRINPDRIEFEFDYDEQRVYYAEYLDCSDRHVPEDSTLEEEVRKDKELFLQKAAINPHIDIVDVETEIDGEEEMIKIVMDQSELEAVASLTGELLGFILEEDEDMFYNKFKGFVERARQEKDMDI